MSGVRRNPVVLRPGSEGQILAISRHFLLTPDGFGRLVSKLLIPPGRELVVAWPAIGSIKPAYMLLVPNVEANVHTGDNVLRLIKAANAQACFMHAMKTYRAATSRAEATLDIL